MDTLAVTAFFHGFHHQVLCSDKRQGFPQIFFTHPGVDMKPPGYIDHQLQHTVGGKKGFRQGDAPVGGIIQCPFTPLGAGGHVSVLTQGYQMAAEAAYALTANGITLIGHGGGTDLPSAKGLFQLPPGLEQPHILSKTIAADAQRSQEMKNAGIQFPGIGLTRDVKDRDIP